MEVVKIQPKSMPVLYGCGRVEATVDGNLRLLVAFSIHSEFNENIVRFLENEASRLLLQMTLLV